MESSFDDLSHKHHEIQLTHIQWLESTKQSLFTCNSLYYNIGLVLNASN